jgi:hypothetical protein
MAATEFGDRTAIVRLKLQLSEAVERAYALAWAVARLEGRAEGAEAERAARDIITDALAPSTHALDSNVVSFGQRDLRNDVRSLDHSRTGESGASPQEMLLAILKENEASVRELQTALDDYGLTVSPGNLSVILSRMNQAGLIQRTGRGLYRYAR